MLMRWDGGSWTEVTLPSDLDKKTTFLNSVSAIAPDDVWVVGYTGYPAWDTLALHWNGSRWTRVKTPDAGQGPDDQNSLQYVAAARKREVWASGTTFPWEHKPKIKTLLRWNGLYWKLVAKSETFPGGDVAADGTGGVWIASDTRLWNFRNGTLTEAKMPVSLSAETVTQVPGTQQAWVPGNMRTATGDDKAFILTNH